MKRILTLFACLGLLSQVASAQTIFEDNFDYGGTNGNLVDLTANWDHHSGSGDSIQYVAGSSLAYPGYGSSNVGGSFTMAHGGGSREDINRSFTDVTSGSVYAAMLVDVTNSGGTSSTYFFHLWDDGGTSPSSFNFRSRLFVREGSGGANTVNFGVSKASSSNVSWSGDFNTGTPYLLVAKYEFNPAANDDSVSLYIIDAAVPAMEPMNPSLNALDNTASDAAQIRSTAFRQGGSGSTAALTIDGLRVADNWGDAVGASGLIFNDNFDYGGTPGDLVSLTPNWDTHSGSGSPIQYGTTSLTYTTYGSSGVGGSFTMSHGGGSRQDINRSFADITTGNVYAAMLVDVTNTGGTSATYFGHLWDDGGANPSSFNFRSRLFVREGSGGPATVNFGISKASSSNVSWSTDYPIGDPYLLVAKYEFNPASNDDSVSLYIIDAAVPMMEPANPSLNALDNTASDAAQIRSMAFRQGGSGSTAALTVDGLRIANNWDDAIGFTPLAANPVTGLTVTPTSTTTADISWFTPAGYGASTHSTLVFLKEASAVTAGTPNAGVATYTASTDFNNPGTAYQNDAAAYTVYNGDGSTVAVTDLMPNTDYHVLVYTVIDADSTYSTGETAMGTTLTPPTVPVLTFNSAFYGGAEAGGGTIDMLVDIANADGNATSVDVVLGTSTATQGVDFTYATPNTITFPAGSTTSVAISIPVVDDKLVEGDETFVLRLQNPTNNAVLGTTDSTVAIITDDDFSEISFDVTAQNVNEQDSATVQVNLTSPNVNGPTTVDIAAVDGTASSGSDYNFAQTTLTFNGPNDTIQEVKVGIVDRDITESNETFDMVLSNPSVSAMITPNAQNTVTIVNRASYPSPTIGQINTVNADGIADSLGRRYDISATVYSINFRSGGLTLTIRDQTGGIGVFENSQDFGYPNAQPGDSVRLIGQIAQFNGLTQFGSLDTIMLISTGNPVADPRKVTQLDESTESDLVYFENAEFITPLPVWPTGSGNYWIKSGTDSIQIRVDSDTDLGGTPTPTGPFTVVGVGGQFDSSVPHTSGYQLFPRFLADIIVGDTLSLDDAPSITVAEDAGAVSINVELENPVALPVNVTVSAVGGSATAGTDYTFASQSVTFPLGNNTTQVVTLTVIDDNDVEDNDTVLIALSNPNLNTWLDPSADTLMIIITDNDVMSGINEILGQYNVRTFPNPATSLVNVEADAAIEQVRILDVMGREVYRSEVADRKHQIATDTIKSGVYFLQVQIDGQIGTRRLIIE